ncbi:hypothetical protein ET495_03480 [Xylanimonas allomyrinae]|uniref:Uncharacterized protein n=1 Tax=Xylanimonas allomyrinae TaxID=2509459 RepID=A0A4P6EWT8_9MICO|nr:hypothetical protein [Xylanimonas allomyrinae]QAY62468.1 hypothetical protein ET495_03480 [Xylanimonas allomyrinae]
MNTDTQIGERICDLQRQVRGFVAGRLRAGTTAPVVRDELGDITTAIDDVLGDVAATLWAKRDTWTPLGGVDQRRWTFTVARNLTERRLAAARGVMVRKTKIAPVLDGLGDAHHANDDLLAAVAHLRGVIDREAGPGAWDHVLAGALRNHSAGLRADLRAAIEAARDGDEIAIKSILRRVRADWRAWATARIETGEPLRPVDAVDLGLFPGTVAATSALTAWWAERRHALGQPVDRHALCASGLVDHLGTSDGARLQAADDLLIWLRRSASTVAAA